jgi:hypothetical protein
MFGGVPRRMLGRMLGVIHPNGRSGDCSAEWSAECPAERS